MGWNHQPVFFSIQKSRLIIWNQCMSTAPPQMAGKAKKNESTRGQMAVFLGHSVLLIFSFEHHHPVLCFFLMLLVGLEDVWCCDLQRRREKPKMTPHTKPADPIVFRTQRPANDESRRSWGLYLWNILHHTGNTRGIKDAKCLEECHAQGLTDRTFQGLLVSEYLWIFSLADLRHCVWNQHL